MTAVADRIALVPSDAPRSDALRLTLADFAPGQSSTSMAWWHKRPAAEPRFELPEFPTLDEAWTLWLFLKAEKGPVDPRLEAMCRYAEDARQGRWTDRIPVEATVQAVYLALAQEALIGAKSTARFLEEAWALFDAVAAQLEAGRPLLDEPFLLSVPRLQRYVAALKEDQRLFAEDLRLSKRYRVTLPPEASISGGAR